MANSIKKTILILSLLISLIACKKTDNNVNVVTNTTPTYSTEQCGISLVQENVALDSCSVTLNGSKITIPYNQLINCSDTTLIKLGDVLHIYMKTSEVFNVYNNQFHFGYTMSLSCNTTFKASHNLCSDNCSNGNIQAQSNTILQIINDTYIIVSKQSSPGAPYYLCFQKQ